jgi:50S ribosomal subunit-associated GTPase HflX
MFDVLRDLFDKKAEADYLWAGFVAPLKGKVKNLKAELVVIESEVSGKTVQFISSPSSVQIVQRT